MPPRRELAGIWATVLAEDLSDPTAQHAGGRGMKSHLALNRESPDAVLRAILAKLGYDEERDPLRPPGAPGVRASTR